MATREKKQQLIDSMMSKHLEDKCDPGGDWHDFVSFLRYQAQTVFWGMAVYIVVQLVYLVTGRLI